MKSKSLSSYKGKRSRLYRLAVEYTRDGKLSVADTDYVRSYFDRLANTGQVTAYGNAIGLFGGERSLSTLVEMSLMEQFHDLTVLAMEMPLQDEEEYRDSVLVPQEGGFSERLRRYFQAVVATVSRAVVRRINRGDSPEELDAFIEVRVNRTNADLEPILRDLIIGGYVAGSTAFAQVARIPTSINLSFNVLNVEALEYVRSETELLISQVSRETHRIINEIVQRGLENGASPTDIAREIRGVSGFDNSLFRRDRNGRDRADRIATRELNHRYTEGLLAIGRQFDDEDGLSVFKRWRDSSDERVRPLHRQLGRTGWVPINQVYAGGISPGSEVNCRCYLQIDVRVDE